MSDSNQKIALLTGATRRIGAAIACRLHAAGMDLLIHYRSSRDSAEVLAASLNAARAGSVTLLQADLEHDDQVAGLGEAVLARVDRLDLLVNNASEFEATPLGQVDFADWDRVMASNLRAPYFLSQALAPLLARHNGSIVSIADIHGQQPLRDFSVYSIAKAGLLMMTRSLARELGPAVRVNAVAPGSILWPESGVDEAARKRILDRTALKRRGEPDDIAAAVEYLALHADYVTGQVLAVDGGRSLNM